MATARGATLLGPDKLEIREYPIPDIPPDGGLLKVEMGGVCGTDVKYLHGKLQVPYPIILGHEILARVEKLGRNAAQIHKVKEGDRVILKGALGCGRCADCSPPGFSTVTVPGIAGLVCSTGAGHSVGRFGGWAS